MAAARVAFIRALAAHTPALNDLRRRRVKPPPVVEEERERQKRAHIWVEHRLEPSWLDLSRRALVGFAEAHRVKAAQDWTRKWKLSGADWIEKWAIFALLSWDIACRCPQPDCRYGCGAADGVDDFAALSLVLTEDILLALEAGDGIDVSVSVRAEGGRVPVVGRAVRLPKECDLFVSAFLGPNPLLETRDEFFRRASDEWTEAVEELEARELSVVVPRKIELHAEWVVRYQVLGKTAADIVGAENTDASTVYKAARSFALLIGLPIRTN